MRAEGSTHSLQVAVAKAVMAFARLRQSSSAAFLCPPRRFIHSTALVRSAHQAAHSFSDLESTGCYAWLAVLVAQATGGSSFAFVQHTDRLQKQNKPPPSVLGTLLSR